MLKIAELTSDDVGRWVEYTAPHGVKERGRIKSFNDSFVFVVYHCAQQWYEYMNYTGCATKPEDLTFI